MVRPHRGDRDGNAGALLRRSSLVLGLAVVVVVAGFGGTASAAVTGLQRVEAESLSNSTGSRGVIVRCPAGKQVLGGGAELIGGVQEVALNDLIPNGALTSFTAEAFEDQTGYAGSWSVRAYAICATPPPGLERVLATSPTDSLNKTVTATCPAGKRLLGAGGGISGGAGEVILEDARPPNLTRVTTQGAEDQDGTASDWLLRAYAICANPVHLLERVVATSPTDSEKAKSVTATCPFGKQVVGSGAELSGGGGQVVLRNLRPGGFPPLNSVIAQGMEDEDGTATNWFVRAIAICAAVSRRTVATTPSDGEFSGVANAPCVTTIPHDGKLVTGGGGDITGGAGQVWIYRSFPEVSSWGAWAVEDENGFAPSWLLRAYAICATPLPGREEVSAASPTDSSSPKSATATCPAGKRLLGGGGEIVSGGGQVVLDDVTPNPALTSVTATGYEDETGSSGNWAADAHAVCATPPPGLERIAATSPLDSTVSKSVNATCPAGKNLLGTGAEIDGGLGQVVLDDLTPNAALTSVTVTGREDETGHAGNWSLRSYAICANP